MRALGYCECCKLSAKLLAFVQGLCETDFVTKYRRQNGGENILKSRTRMENMAIYDHKMK